MIQAILTEVEKVIGKKIDSQRSVGGGSINDAYELKTSGESYFLKVNSASRYPNMFKREKEGLDVLNGTKSIRIPETILVGEVSDKAFILMNFLKSGAQGPSFWDEFGSQLATLHRASADEFGFENDNYIGSLPQSNAWKETWSEFFIHERIEPLVKQARDIGQFDRGTVSAFDGLYTRLEDFFPVEKPSLIHGDLWSGNYMSDENGMPAIFDPAIYYGHREMDIGMSKLFGGFSSRFYEAYNEFLPMESGWQERVQVANLYPLLVHVILFGGSYAYDVERILKRF